MRACVLPGVPVSKKSLLKAASLLALASTGSANASDGGPGDRPEPQFVPMPMIVVPIIGSDTIEGSLRFKLVLAAKDEAGKEHLTETLPVLRAVSVAGAMEFARLFASAQRPVDVGRLSTDLTKALKTADAQVDRVLIVEVSAVT